jgi:phosphatidate phosphatase PAH1
MRGLTLLVLLVGCDGGEEPECLPTHAIVSDIDETLTTADTEWVTQVAKGGDYDPAERPDASTLMNAYADQGYAIYYVTARGTLVTLGDGRTGPEATSDWLVAHGFPYQESNLYLAPGMSTAGEAARTYKAGVLADLKATGLQIAWAYGNATSDIDAFKDAAVPDDHIFLVGRLAGEMDVVGIGDDDAFSAHMASHMSTVPDQTDCR